MNYADRVPTYIPNIWPCDICSQEMESVLSKSNDGRALERVFRCHDCGRIMSLEEVNKVALQN